ncbi:LysR family transcriptional regulator [Ferrimonas sediminicola]|uniref:LysR family transcriptional regulator n=1 Tax=Ferrimonas sediminicola TaxID=2569538 RepID=A0A4U1BGV0_9GAMM|nr:LysR family transcriptional regulator [Ferrimonas sediminicola]TKB50578.1 LysR family transcriptional regulator [Ferrimonas sediminicola]
MKSLQDLTLFIHTARLGSLSACARRMDLTPAAVSAAIKRLEAELGYALFVRTTRSIRLTAEGERFLGAVTEGVGLIEQAARPGRSRGEGLSGTLQLSIPSALGRERLLGALDRFMEDNPQLELSLSLTDRISDGFNQPVDLALRYGDAAASGLISLPVVPDNRRILVASPHYLERQGRPRSPQALLEHQCLCFVLGDRQYDLWRFWVEGRLHQVRVSGRRRCDDGALVQQWAREGRGIAYKSALDVKGDLDRGTLVAVAPDWLGEPAPLSLLVTDRHRLTPAVRALHRLFRAELT